MNTNRALNTDQASNTSQGSHLIVLIEAGPWIEARPQTQAGFKNWLNWWVYFLNVCMLSNEWNMWVYGLHFACHQLAVCGQAGSWIEAGPRLKLWPDCTTSNRSQELLFTDLQWGDSVQCLGMLRPLCRIFLAAPILKMFWAPTYMYTT